MNKKEKEVYITRMALRDYRGWTQKMIDTLLKDVSYKKWGNIYRRWHNKIIFF